MGPHESSSKIVDQLDTLINNYGLISCQSMLIFHLKLKSKFILFSSLSIFLYLNSAINKYYGYFPNDFEIIFVNINIHLINKCTYNCMYIPNTCINIRNQHRLF